MSFIEPVPIWMPFALSELRVSEIVGTKNNPRIVDYWDMGHIPGAVNDDETPWCHAFVCANLERVGVISARSGQAKAALKWGQLVVADPGKEPFGAIVVLHRTDASDWRGHVGFCVGGDELHIHLLGGNQGNQVSIASFPRTRLAGVRWPNDVPMISTVIGLEPTSHNPSDR